MLDDGSGRQASRAKLYTDGDGAIYERQQQFQEKTFQTVALPFYAVIDGNGQAVSTFPGLTRDVQEFVDFLQKSQENQATGKTAVLKKNSENNL